MINFLYYYKSCNSCIAKDIKMEAKLQQYVNPVDAILQAEQMSDRAPIAMNVAYF